MAVQSTPQTIQCRKVWEDGWKQFPELWIRCLIRNISIQILILVGTSTVVRNPKLSGPKLELNLNSVTMSFGSRAAERLANKIVLITGASSGIGAATARELASAANGNIKLILTARRENRLTDLALELTKAYGPIRIHTAKLDVSDSAAIKPFITGLPTEFASIDVLINNAGKALGKDNVGSMTAEDINGMMQTNVLGLINMTQAVLPIFKEKNAGDVVNIGSIAGKEPYPGGSVYCASKAAVNFFTHSLRKELISTKIRVLEVDPGAVETEFSVVRFHGDKAAADKVYEGCEPLTAEDIAEVIVFGLSRKQNTVIAETLVFPSHQAGASHVYKA